MKHLKHFLEFNEGIINNSDTVINIDLEQFNKIVKRAFDNNQKPWLVFDNTSRPNVEHFTSNDFSNYLMSEKTQLAPVVISITEDSFSKIESYISNRCYLCVVDGGIDNTIKNRIQLHRFI